MAEILCRRGGQALPRFRVALSSKLIFSNLLSSKKFRTGYGGVQLILQSSMFFFCNVAAIRLLAHGRGSVTVFPFTECTLSNKTPRRPWLRGQACPREATVFTLQVPSMARARTASSKVWFHSVALWGFTCSHLPLD